MLRALRSAYRPSRAGWQLRWAQQRCVDLGFSLRIVHKTKHTLAHHEARHSVELQMHARKTLSIA